MQTQESASGYVAVAPGHESPAVPTAETFDASIRTSYSRIVQLAHSYTYDTEEALDLAQEVFLRAHQAFPAFKGRSSVHTWLHRIAINTCIDHVRRSKTQFDADQVRVGGDPDGVGVLGVDRRTPLDMALDDEIGSQISEAIQSLPPRQRQVFELRHRRGLSMNEIASVVGRRIGTVKRQLFDATHKMRSSLALVATEEPPARPTGFETSSHAA